MNYQILKDFIKAIVKSVKIGVNETEFGVATYSDLNKFQLHINFSSYSNTSEIVEAVQRIPYDAGDTYTGNGLNRIRTELFSQSRDGIPKILIAITDGQSQDSVETPSSTLRAMKVHIMSVGIGEVVYAELTSMATYPDSQNVFTANFSSIHDVVGYIIENSCRGECKNVLGGRWVIFIFKMCLSSGIGATILSQPKRSEIRCCQEFYKCHPPSQSRIEEVVVAVLEVATLMNIVKPCKRKTIVMRY